MHVLIVGNSFSGKTKLAQRLAADKSRVIVYDPNRSAHWPTHAKKFSDPARFLDFIETQESCYVFVDEAKTLWDFDSDRADRLTYAGRHRGLLLFLIAQRTRMVPPNSRNQCSRVFAFRQQLADAQTLADEYHPDMLGTCKLPPVHFIATNGFASWEGSLDFAQGEPPQIKSTLKLENKG